MILLHSFVQDILAEPQTCVGQVAFPKGMFGNSMFGSFQKRKSKQTHSRNKCSTSNNG